MKICALQLAARLGDRPANMANASARIALAMGMASNVPDVLVLPELWDVGFYPDNVLELGDNDGRMARDFLSAQAARHKVNIVGGSIVRRQGDRVWNTAYVFDRGGNLISTYNKTHLFSLAGEQHAFQPGESVALYELDGVPVGGITCYDIRFCELTRRIALAGARVLFAPAAWPHPRLNHWRVLAQARAIENQMFVIAVNNCGRSGDMKFCGHSLMIDPWGEIIAEADEEEQILAGTCDLSVVAHIREHLNVFRDRRPELYGDGATWV